jgi:hypothetical protein
LLYAVLWFWKKKKKNKKTNEKFFSHNIYIFYD